MGKEMIHVIFIKWYPFSKEIPIDFILNEIREYEYNDQWLTIVYRLIELGFFVGIHRDANTKLITVMIDTTWFKQR